MAQLTKILRNTGSGTFQILNREITVGESYDVPYHLWFELADSTLIVSQIETGIITVNNGTQDLSIPDAVNWVTTFQPKSVGLSKRFINETLTIDSSEEMIVSDSVTLGTSGVIVVNGMLTILNF
jgi:hypothetical protein